MGRRDADARNTAGAAFSDIRRPVREPAGIAPTGGARVVARCGDGLYSSPVHKFPWQRWVLILLLVSRLVSAELGHAMPVAEGDASEPAMSMAACDSAECEESTADQMPTSHHVGADSQDMKDMQDCCKSGDCECPCLHAPYASLDALVLNSLGTTLLRMPQGTDGVVSQHPSDLFRPPA